MELAEPVAHPLGSEGGEEVQGSARLLVRPGEFTDGEVCAGDPEVAEGGAADAVGGPEFEGAAQELEGLFCAVGVVGCAVVFRGDLAGDAGGADSSASSKKAICGGSSARTGPG
ncbi:hypothetical protein ACH432_25610 [Streptomyces jumonjinensis]|uniref:hypothetical protein n=1 Tax=Streptomyces jumonjinensis TaxID=1945 RepID=UPI003792AC48